MGLALNLRSCVSRNTSVEFVKIDPPVTGRKTSGSNIGDFIFYGCIGK